MSYFMVYGIIMVSYVTITVSFLSFPYYILTSSSNSHRVHKIIENQSIKALKSSFSGNECNNSTDITPAVLNNEINSSDDTKTVEFENDSELTINEMISTSQDTIFDDYRSVISQYLISSRESWQSCLFDLNLLQ